MELKPSLVLVWAAVLLLSAAIAKGSVFSKATRGANGDVSVRSGVVGLHTRAHDHVAFQNLKIGAFNVRTFGQKKMGYAGVPEILVKILLRYHVVLIQEIRDSTHQAMPALLRRLNRASSFLYNMSISERLGRTSSKEQYAFLYRSDLLSVKRAYVYDDGDEAAGQDAFEREPYIVHFHSPFTVIQDFALVAIHTSPRSAASEVDKLVDVYDDVTRRWSMNDVIILGDLNAACSYMKDSDWTSNRLATDPRFHWLISDCVDTTVAGSACAYDRFVSAGAAVTSAVVPGSAGRFKFDSAYGLSKDVAEKVSDHFPIEMEIYCQDLSNAMNAVHQTNEYKFLAVSPPAINSNLIYKLRYAKSNQLLRQGFACDTKYLRSAVSIVENTKDVKTSQDAVQALQQIYTSWSTLVTKSQIDMASYKAAQGLGRASVLVKLVCKKLPAPEECWVALEI